MLLFSQCARSWNPEDRISELHWSARDQGMSGKTRFVVALTGMVVVLIGELAAVFELRALATSPAFIIGFAATAGLGFWAMSFHRLGR